MANVHPTVTPQPPPVTAAPAPAAPPPAAKSASFLTHLILGTSKSGEIVIYHHSTLFYWWPVWALGFLMAVITYFGNKHMAIVPAGTLPTTATSGEYKTGAGDTKPLAERNILVLPEKAKHWQRKDASGEIRPVEPTIYIAEQKSVGTVFIFVLLLVIAITNVHMRGLWSFFILLVLVMLTIIAAVAGWWEAIFSGLGQLSIHINMGGYLLLSSVLFVLWLVNFAVFDRQTYMIFAPGQVRMRLEIGGGETVYDTTGMVVQKQRSDLFRHWILGFGSGDLIVRPVGVANPIDMPNVLRVGRKVRLIENLVKEKVILTQP